MSALAASPSAPAKTTRRTQTNGYTAVLNQLRADGIKFIISLGSISPEFTPARRTG